MMELLFKLLSSGLELWNTEDKHRYVNKLIQLRKEWYEEVNKEQHDNARIDDIEFQLRLLIDSFVSSIASKQ